MAKLEPCLDFPVAASSNSAKADDLEDDGCGSDSSFGSDYGDEPPDTEPWKNALANGTEFTVPRVRTEIHDGQVEWRYPETLEHHHRYLIFKDLHQRGYRITAGSKFGADYLLYPGDPTQFHAQFCVRVMPHDVPIVPVNLSAACRGSFQARKHLLYASVGPDQEILYTTFGQVGGFG